MNFKVFKQAVAKRFAEMQSPSTTLFIADISGDGLWAAYLNAFPEGSNPIFRERTEHDCSCCKQFIRHAGGLVTVGEGGLNTIWDFILENEPEYQAVADKLGALVRSAKIRGLFLYDQATVGTDHNFETRVNGNVHEWHHFHLTLPRNVVKRGSDIPSLLGAHRSMRDLYKRGLETITFDALDTVIDLSKQNSLYRGQEFSHMVEMFRNHKVEFNKAKDKELYAWANMPKSDAVATIRNSAIGTLLVDLSEGMGLEAAVCAYEVKVAPANYKRPTALATPAMISAAKAELENLGLLSALNRRYGHLDDITINNVLFADRSTRKALGVDVFDALASSTPVKQSTFDKVEELSIDKFLSDVVPRAERLELLVENRHVGNFVSLIAPEDPTARHLFKWQNNFSWTYAGNVTDSIKERVKAAGGNITGEFRCSLGWFNYDDLDLSMHEPDGYMIYFANRTARSPSGGTLDVDMNALAGRTREAVENIVYASLSTMRNGVYTLQVHNFQRRESVDVGFEVEICLNGVSTTLVHKQAVRDGQRVDVAKFTVHNGEVRSEFLLPEGASPREVWNLTTMNFVPVSAIMLSPNYWDDQGVGNKHWFFMLDGCKNPEATRGIFNEFLNSDLDKHRKVMEMVGSKMNTGSADTQLSGLGFSSTVRNSVLCRVHGSFNRVVRVLF